MVTGCNHLILLNRCFVLNRRNKVIQVWNDMRVSKLNFHFCLNNSFTSRCKWILDLKDFSLFAKSFAHRMPLCMSNEHVNFYMLWDVIWTFWDCDLLFFIFVKFHFSFSFTRESVRQVLGRAALIRTKCWWRLVERDPWGGGPTGMGWFSNYVKGS